MKNLFISFLLLLSTHLATAQKTEYKDGQFTVDGTPVAKMIKSEHAGSMGMINDYEIQTLDGKTLIIAAVADDYPEDKNDNMAYIFKFSFVSLDKVGYFKVSKLGAEKSVSKLINGGNLFKDGGINPEAAFALIAKQGKTPPVKAADYSLVNRDKSWPLTLKESNIIEQQSKQIGMWKDVTPNGANVDKYEFSLPSGLKLADVSFMGGNNAKTCEIITLKDGRKHTADIAIADSIKLLMTNIDRNQKALERIVKWLVQNQYL